MLDVADELVKKGYSHGDTIQVTVQDPDYRPQDRTFLAKHGIVVLDLTWHQAQDLGAAERYTRPHTLFLDWGVFLKPKICHQLWLVRTAMQISIPRTVLNHYLQRDDLSEAIDDCEAAHHKVEFPSLDDYEYAFPGFRIYWLKRFGRRMAE